MMQDKVSYREIRGLQSSKIETQFLDLSGLMWTAADVQKFLLKVLRNHLPSLLTARQLTKISVVRNGLVAKSEDLRESNQVNSGKSSRNRMQ